MNGPLRQKVIITNPNGFHMRPAAAFAAIAKQFQSDVRVIKDELRVDGKSVLELMCLVALPGSELEIEVSGADASNALPALVDCMNTLPDDPTNGAVAAEK